MTPLLRPLVAPLATAVVALGACTAAGPQRAATTAPGVAMAGALAGAAPASTTATAIPEAIEVSGSFTVEVPAIEAAATALRAQIDALGGRVVNDDVDGGAQAWRAELQVRVPPAQVEALAAWLDAHGDVIARHVTGTDVSRTLFDQDLALANLRATSERLTQLLGQGGLSMSDILAVENELTRVRGEIERIEGEHRYLTDRVALATLTIALVRADGAVDVARAKAYPGLRFAALTLLDPDGRPRTRLGGGLVLHTVLRNASLEVDVFEAAADRAGGRAKRAAIATLGGAGYSDFLGRGRRRIGNPYLGLRLGYAYLDTSRFAVQGEAGLELWKGTHGLVDVNLRATGLIGERTDLAVVAGAGAVVAF